jgi:hypothetical protein
MILLRESNAVCLFVREKQTTLVLNYVVLVFEVTNIIEDFIQRQLERGSCNFGRFVRIVNYSQKMFVIETRKCGIALHDAAWIMQDLICHQTSNEPLIQWVTEAQFDRGICEREIPFQMNSKS